MSPEEVVAQALDSILADPRPSTLVNRDRARIALHALKDARYAVVKLPESGGVDDDGQEWFCDGDFRVDHSSPGSEWPNLYAGSIPYEPDDLRREAAGMLAAANAAEADQ
ncbi:hypothetical protein [Mycolicibacterium neoaurum]|uniref:hypothetical protein n=1 Tax=Mycolicibacterium neoaurum TaxID=1795 RepID=UPI00114D4DDF|nr:hypothetical protein [Mycolicibacterium neoaurum]